MRMQSRKKVVVKDIVFGGEKVLTCIPLVSKDKKRLIEESKEVYLLDPDIVELRVDFFEAVSDINKVKETLLILSEINDQITLIFNLRHSKEGGQANLSQDKRIEIIKKSIETDCVDILD